MNRVYRISALIIILPGTRGISRQFPRVITPVLTSEPLVHCTRVRNDPGASHHRTAARGRSQHQAEYSVRKQKWSVKVKMTEEYLLAWNDHHATFFSAMSDLVAGT